MKKHLLTLIITMMALQGMAQGDCTTEGDPAVFGTNQWTVYAFQNGSQYYGYYTEPSVSFNTNDRWGITGRPSDASGYVGCEISREWFKISAKRKGFPCGDYSIDIPGHDDDATLFINGVQVWQHNGSGDAHSAIWTGRLDQNSEVEFVLLELGGDAFGRIQFNLLSTTPVVSGTSYLCYSASNGTVAATDIPGASYLWSPGGQTSSSISNLTIGTYSVNVSHEDCNYPLSFTISNYPTSSPISIQSAGATAVCSGSGVNLCVPNRPDSFIYTIQVLYNDENLNPIRGLKRYITDRKNFTIQEDNSYASVLNGVSAIARNPSDGKIYFLNTIDGTRRLNTIDITHNIVTELGTITPTTSVTGMTFDNSGNLFVVYGRNLYKYNLSDPTLTPTEIVMNPVLTIFGSRGLDYDFDNNRLIISATDNSGDGLFYKFYAVNITTGQRTFLQGLPIGTATIGSKFAYVGNNKVYYNMSTTGELGELDLVTGSYRTTTAGTLTGVVGFTLAPGGEFQWSANGTLAGTNACLQASAVIQTNYSVIYTDVNGCPSNASQAISILPTQWTGNSSTLWSQAANWGCGTVPGANDEIVIPNTANKPVLDIDYTAGGSLLMQAGSSLTVNPNKTLAVSGTANFNSQPLIFKSDATGTASLGASSGSINGADNVTVERYLPVANVPTGRSWRLLTIPVKSSAKTIRDAWGGHAANSNAPSGEIAGSGTLITGQAYTNGNTAAAAGYDWWSAISGASSSIRRYTISGSSGAWTATPSTTSLLNAAEEGYMLFVRGDRTVTTGSGFTTLRPNGSIRTGTQTYTIPAPATAAYKVIGNPYPATISFETMMSRSANSALASDSRFWQWDANLGTNGAYRLVAKQPGVGNWLRVPAAFSDPSPSHAEYISSSQAFIVETLASGNNFTIEESDKPATLTGNPPSVFDISNAGRFYANLNIDNGNNSLVLSDGILASFDVTNNSGIDGADASKIDNFNENMSILRNGKQLTLEARKPVNNNTSDTIFLQLRNMQVRNYALQFKSAQMQAGLLAVLQDTYTGKEMNISTMDNDITTYNFTVSSAAGSAATDRFRVVFKAGQILPLVLTDAKAYTLNNGIQVDWRTVNEKGVKNYEVEKSTDGRSFDKATTVAASGEGNYGWYDAAPGQGNNYYRIKIIGIDGSISYSAILKLTTHHSPLTTFTFYPNPVKGSSVTLQLSNLEKGKYTLNVYNNIGQLMMTNAIEPNGGSATEEIKLRDNLAAGVYRVSLTSTKGTSQEQSIIIQR